MIPRRAVTWPCSVERGLLNPETRFTLVVTLLLVYAVLTLFLLMFLSRRL
jgi:hypothetical protein